MSTEPDSGQTKKSKPGMSISMEHALWQMLRRTDRVIYKARQRELDRYGISTEAAAVLFTVQRLGRRAIPALIARQLFLERPSVSELLDRMEKDGLLQRVKDLERKNYVRIVLTAQGFEAYRKSARRRSTRRIMSVLSRDEQELMWAMLARVRTTALTELGIKTADIYPPSDPKDR